MGARIVIDLTELLAKTGGPDKYYGIARVVAEVAAAMVRDTRSVEFCVFNLGDRKFYRITPNLQADMPMGVDLMVPSLKLRHLRTMTGARFSRRDRLYPLARFLVTIYNRSIDLPVRTLEPINLDGAYVFSASRPKLMVELIAAARLQGLSVNWCPLYHDVMPFYDFNTAEHPPRFQNRYLADTVFIFENARLVLANSEFTLEEIKHYAEAGLIPQPKALASTPLVQEFTAASEMPEITVPRQPYFLVVGGLLGRKNLGQVFEAMRLLHERGEKLPQLVLAGRPRKRLQTYLSKPKLRDILPHISQVDSPSQVDLGCLYSHALALIIPSRVEGWGLPAGEALWQGTPVIAADIPVLHEVCGDLAQYFDPEDAEALASKMTIFLKDKNFVQRVRQEIRAARPSLRRWSDVADDIVTQIDRLANSC